MNRVLGGKTTPPNIFFRPILPKFKEIFEIVVGDFERWPMLPVRKTDDYGDGKERTVLVFCDEPWNGHKNDKTAMMTL